MVPEDRVEASPDVHAAFFTEVYRPVVNGVVNSIDALRDGLRANSVEVTIVAPHAPHFRDDGDDVVRIPSLPLPTPTAYRLCLPFIGGADRSRLRDVDLVHAHSPFVTGWMGAQFARRRGLPLVFTYHTRLDLYAHYAPFDRGATERAMVTLTRRYANAADTVIVPTAAMETELRAMGVFVPIAIVPSAVDVERFAAGRRRPETRAAMGALGAAPLVLAVARLGAEKNLELALDAMARLPEARLAIVGDGPHAAALAEQARMLGIAGRVCFLGEIARERLPDIYAAADAFVFTSTTDTQGLVLAEALAAGLPVVAAESAASRDVLDGCGAVVAPEPAAIAAALADACRGGRDHSATLMAFSRYTVGLQARRILDVYREVLAARAA